MPKLRKNYTGLVVGNRFVLRFSHFTKANDPMWIVRCLTCNNVFSSLTQDLYRKHCRRCTSYDLRKRPFESLYNTFRKRAKHKVELTYEQFLVLTQIKYCHYCDLPIKWPEFQNKKKFKGQPYYLDRKDNSKDYTFDNVVVCCSRCNRGKNKDFSYEEWKRIGKVIRAMREEQANEKTTPITINPDWAYGPDALPAPYHRRGRQLVLEGIRGPQNGQRDAVPTDQADGCASDSPTGYEVAAHQYRLPHLFNGDGDRNG